MHSNKTNEQVPSFVNLRFPDHFAARKSSFYTLENDDIQTDEDIASLLRRMFEYEEASFYLYVPATETVNQLVGHAIGANKIVILESAPRYFPHPSFRRDYIFIRENPLWDWEQEVLRTAPMFIRHQLKLTAHCRRTFELDGVCSIQANANPSPFSWELELYGFKVDLKKLLPWLQRRWPWLHW